MEMDDWNVDVVVSASQKCLMTPPGTAFITFSPRAKEFGRKNRSQAVIILT